MDTEYLKHNVAWWNDKVEGHVTSELYDLESWKSGKSSLNKIELDLLGDIKGKRLLHLQCHFGQDTLSLQRMGAEVTGVDFSKAAIETARGLAQSEPGDARFYISDIYEFPKQHTEQYDIVYATYGVIGWHPDIQRWMDVAAGYVAPGGRLIFVEFHPVVWMYDDDIIEILFSYFNGPPIVEETSTSYARKEEGKKMKVISWNHGLADVISAGLSAGLQLTHCKEYDYSPYDVYTDSNGADRHYQIKGLEGKLPLVYSLVYTRPPL